MGVATISYDSDITIGQSRNASIAGEVAVEVTSKPEQLSSADISTVISIVVDLLAEVALTNSKVEELLHFWMMINVKNKFNVGERKLFSNN